MSFPWHIFYYLWLVGLSVVGVSVSNDGQNGPTPIDIYSVRDTIYIIATSWGFSVAATTDFPQLDGAMIPGELK